MDNGTAQTFSPLDEAEKSGIRILVIDDEATLRETCVNVLRMQGFDVSAAGRGEEALDLVRRRDYDIILCDLYMTQVPGIDLLRAALEHRPETIFVTMTGNPSVESNLKVLEAGAWDYLPKPFSASHIEILIGRAAHAVVRQRDEGSGGDVATLETAGADHAVVGTSPAFREALDLAKKVARSHASVFITGESGSGKELVAHFIHQHSRRANRRMVAINCAALPEPLLESEMFGHEKGAFTGAVREKEGLFETANGGTLFLDELTEMSQPIQAKLLRVLQDGMVRRVGSTQTDAMVDVRIIAATNRDPREAVEAGDLRSDLYYRLRVVPIRVPPLRERREDIPLLAKHFLQQYWKRDNPRNKPPVFTDAAMEALVHHTWPGNVRELQNVVEHTMVLMEPGAEILAEDIPFMGDAEPSLAGGGTSFFGEHLASQPYHEAREAVLTEFEKGYITSLVNRAGGNMSKAARLAGVDRTTLYRLIEKHDLERDTILRSR
ncbi:MAG TPA: sigma-54 dependent transcriptional regulator [Longimicrobiales bacterium]|nr:sigma-54 dependent transcriptional regulator [Longimicrobiales bacterium]